MQMMIIIVVVLVAMGFVLGVLIGIRATEVLHPRRERRLAEQRRRLHQVRHPAEAEIWDRPLHHRTIRSVTTHDAVDLSA